MQNEGTSSKTTEIVRNVAVSRVMAGSELCLAGPFAIGLMGGPTPFGLGVCVLAWLAAIGAFVRMRRTARIFAWVIAICSGLSVLLTVADAASSRFSVHWGVVLARVGLIGGGVSFILAASAVRHLKKSLEVTCPKCRTKWKLDQAEAQKPEFSCADCNTAFSLTPAETIPK